MLFLWRLDKSCLLAKKQISLISNHVFYDHRSGSPIFHSKHRLRCVIVWVCSNWELAAWLFNYWFSNTSMWRCIDRPWTVWANFQILVQLSRYWLVVVVIIEGLRPVAIHIVISSSIRCWVILVHILNNLIAMRIWKSTLCCWRAFIKPSIHSVLNYICWIIQLGFDSTNRLLELVHAIAWRSHDIISTLN